ncbi:sigma-B regulation protein RsbU (phosphoserine phosphatase) [Silvibacterium bohemicum]|uniref:Sigma-B regulation protein RsbU (Phosphoserine phosphatase) n=1 Tax=Silvibacterium bohemicum TaxID=1577686 RepID=A0A841K108_9BACT|nr:SpoIIE family protein phosphatase [Silvibacterium bohemicum]MBB6146665.1 sigma-B regulation protein RsbU (phosphoserine phosphatase) [Silvibacterium bohemicum]
MGHLRNFETAVFRRVRRDPPLGKVHRIAFWLFVFYLALSAGRLLPGQAGVFFGGVSVLTLLLLVAFCIPLLWRWVFGRLMWKVRNRLVVTYLLMGLAPVVLFVTLASILLYVFSGQFAIFAASSEITSELGHIATQDRAFALHIAHMVAQQPKIKVVDLAEAEDSMPVHEDFGMTVAAFEDGQPLALTPSSLHDASISQAPAWYHDNDRGDRFKRIVIHEGKLYLRAIDTQTLGGHTITTITSLPLHRENVDQIARGLGTVTIVPDVQIDDDDMPSDAKPPKKVQFSYQRTARGVKVNGEDLDEMQTRRRSITGGMLPGAQHFYDVTVTFWAPLDTIDWETGKPIQTYAKVSSRPSLLYQRLFITSLKIAAVIQEILIGIAIFFGVIELFAFYMAVRLNRTITRSIRDLYQATVAIDKGDLSHRIQVTRNDQLAALSRSFNRMISSLERLLEEQRQKQRLENELAIAQEVQANLFPRGNISVPSLELHGACYPARTVSGDYYDFLVFGGTSMGLAIGDISGKGISAALLMATLHSAVRAYRFAGEELITAGTAALAIASTRAMGEDEVECGELFEEPSKILALLNRHLYRSTQPEKYATLWLGHYDGLTSRLIYSNGGQLPPFLLRADDSVTRLDCGGTVVGLLNNMSYEQATEQLYPGDILIAYSDGVTEPENEFGEFGEDRLLEVVRRHRHLSLEAISEQVMQSLRTWIGGQEQPDDITLVLARQR